MFAVLSANLTSLATSVGAEAQTIEDASAALLATSSGGLPWAQLPAWSTLPYCTADTCERVIPRSTDFYRSYGFEVRSCISHWIRFNVTGFVCSTNTSNSPTPPVRP